MARQRTDGLKFEEEFRKAIIKAPFPVAVIRLHTPQSCYANVQNLADYIIFARRTIILELKETSAKSFSLNTFQQKEQVEIFKEVFGRARDAYQFSNNYPYRLAILIHFIKEQKFALYFMDENPLKVLHPNPDECILKDTLEEVLEVLGA